MAEIQELNLLLEKEVAILQERFNFFQKHKEILQSSCEKIQSTLDQERIKHLTHENQNEVLKEKLDQQCGEFEQP